MRRIFRDLAPVHLIEPPGRYTDGPAYLRVRRDVGSTWRAGSGLSIARSDPEHHFIPAVNTHCAFAYRQWLRAAGVPSEALSVVRLRD